MLLTNPVKKFLVNGSAVVAVGLAVALPLLAGATTFSTTTVGNAMDDIGSVIFDYIGLMITKFWPVLLGLLAIGAVIFIAKGGLKSLFHR